VRAHHLMTSRSSPASLVVSPGWMQISICFSWIPVAASLRGFGRFVTTAARTSCGSGAGSCLHSCVFHPKRRVSLAMAAIVLRRRSTESGATRSLHAESELQSQTAS